MLFTMPVDKVVCSKMGHTIEFKAGVPTHVPKECWRDVQAEGAVPENQVAAQPAAQSSEPVVDDPVERHNAIFAAFTAMVEENQRDEFAASGSPAIKALTKRVGFAVDVKERDAMWVEFKQKMTS